MRARLSRLRALARRFSVDRRLPPVVWQLISDVARLRILDALERVLARLRPPVGRRSITVGPGPVVRAGARRWRTVGSLDRPVYDLRHVHSSALVDALERRGVPVFLVDDSKLEMTFGVLAEHRDAAGAALVTELRGSGWFLGWQDGPWQGVRPLERATADRRVSRARAWRLFQSRALGNRAIGHESATVLTFWDEGTSGRREMIGTRGQQRFDERSVSTVEVIDERRYPGRAAFPVAADLERFEEPVDLVYTWVDGSDPEWRASFEAFARRERRSRAEEALHPSRFHSRDELRYSLRSAWSNCGWVRNIYLVTAGQRPVWLDPDADVYLVDHREILPADALPTFNSHAIEAAIHRIEGLAEHFVYMNDDVFIGRPLRAESFYTSNGLAKVFRGDARVPDVDETPQQAVDIAARRGRDLLLARFGRMATYKPMHSPHPLRRSVMEEIEEEFPDEVKRTSQHRFRNPADISISASFALHYGVATGRAVYGELSNAYVNVGSRRLPMELSRLLLGRDLDTFCINETEQVHSSRYDRERRVADFFQSYFPVPAPWELGESAIDERR